jgi:hypothetical protein
VSSSAKEAKVVDVPLRCLHGVGKLVSSSMCFPRRSLRTGEIVLQRLLLLLLASFVFLVRGLASGRLLRLLLLLLLLLRLGLLLLLLLPLLALPLGWGSEWRCTLLRLSPFAM